MNKRLEMLEQMAQGGAGDPFAGYGLAMEYRRIGRIEDALTAFAKLRSHHPDYLPMYLMAGQVLLEAQRSTEAKTWLDWGVELATKTGDSKTLGELEAALAEAEE